MTAQKALSAKDMNGLKVTNVGDGSSSGDAINKGQLDTTSAADRSRANHTGTQAASTINDFDTQVRTSRLDQMAAPTGAVGLNNQRLTTIANASADTDAPSWGQVKDLLSGQRKADVRAVATSNITLSAPQTIDGVSVIAGDRVLVAGQSTASANGIYVVAAGAWTRATDADAAAEFATGWLVTVEQGTANADTLWKFDNPGAVTLGTTALAFVKLGPISSGAASGYSATSPTTAAGATWTVNHGLGSRLVLVQVFRSASPYDEVEVYFERTDTNNVAIKPDVAMGSGEYTALVYKVA